MVNWPCDVIQVLDAADALAEAVERTRAGMVEAAQHAMKFDNAALHKVAYSWLATYATRDATAVLPPDGIVTARAYREKK